MLYKCNNLTYFSLYCCPLLCLEQILTTPCDRRAKRHLLPAKCYNTMSTLKLSECAFLASFCFPFVVVCKLIATVEQRYILTVATACCPTFCVPLWWASLLPWESCTWLCQLNTVLFPSSFPANSQWAAYCNGTILEWCINRAYCLWCFLRVLIRFPNLNNFFVT